MHIDDHPLICAVQAFRKRYSDSPGMVVAVSGGPDSVALLLALDQIGVRPLMIGHVNHQLRGGQSDADENFVRELGDRLKLNVEVHRTNTADDAIGRNLEATARRQRYEFFRQVAVTSGLSVVATGHTANDQAETVLFRMLRGSGLTGLAAIRPRRRWHGITIVRPMLNIRRAVVLDFLNQIGQPYRHDVTNEDTRFTRNRIRHELLPLLEASVNENVVEHLARLADRAAEWGELLNGLVRRNLKRVEMARAATLVILDASSLEQIPDSLLREMGRHIWRRENWPESEMDAAHWDRFALTCRGAVTAVDFPGGISVRRLPRVVRIGPGA
jgi:tRNA(Ile)-lysidine synthase